MGQIFYKGRTALISIKVRADPRAALVSGGTKPRNLFLQQLTFAQGYEPFL
jgi:hypothetical protein